MKNTHSIPTVIDVRTMGEFLGGHSEGAINIPLNEIESRLEEIKKMAAPILLCCASGNRSGVAEQILSGHGINCRNAGPWYTVQPV